MTKLTRNIEIKKKFSNPDKLELLKQIAEHDEAINEKQMELSDLQDKAKAIKEYIGTKHEEISSLCSKYRLGYESTWTECVATYNDGIATFTDEKTGEIVEQRPMTEAEQLQLSENRVDAEDIIRAASKAE